MVSRPLLDMSNVAEFHMNFSFSITVPQVTPSNILTMASPDISTMNGEYPLINFFLLALALHIQLEGSVKIYSRN